MDAALDFMADHPWRYVAIVAAIGLALSGCVPKDRPLSASPALQPEIIQPRDK